MFNRKLSDVESDEPQAPLANEDLNITPEDMEVDDDSDEGEKPDDVTTGAAGDAPLSPGQVPDEQSENKTSSIESVEETSLVESINSSSSSPISSSEAQCVSDNSSDSSEERKPGSSDAQAAENSNVEALKNDNEEDSTVTSYSADKTSLTLPLEAATSNATGNNNNQPHCDTPITSPGQQLDEGNSQQYSSFLYWRDPLPDVTDESDVWISLKPESNETSPVMTSNTPNSDDLLNNVNTSAADDATGSATEPFNQDATPSTSFGKFTENFCLLL